MEEYRDIIGYEGLYQVSDKGNVFSLFTNKKLKITYHKKQKDGRVSLYKNGKRKIGIIHRLVALMFIENPKNLPLVNHKDSDRKNNEKENLEWVTSLENNCHCQNNIKERSSSLIGVTYREKKRKWESSIKINKKTIYLGCFDSELEAFEKRKKYELQHNIKNKYLHGNQKNNLSNY